FVLCVVSDHGHITADREVHLNAAFGRAGLIELNEQKKVKSWRAFAWTSGGSAGIMLKELNDEDARNRGREVLKQLQSDAAGGARRVIEGRDASSLNGFQGAAFIVGLKPGFKTGGDLTGEVLRAGKSGGTHGYLPGHRDMDASLFIAGTGIAGSRELGRIEMRDIAPTLAGIMKLSLESTEGRNLLPPAR